MKDNCPLRFEQVSKTYRSGAERLRILDQGDLAIEAGEIVALVAPSGAGKSTLLHLAALLDSPTGGKVFLQGRDTSKLDNAGKTEMRRREVGYVYQSHHLLDEFTALENVLLPQLVNGADEKQARRRGLELLGRFGLQDRASFLPGSLSGGEKQRVAIARALANRPALLLADEPTGNLDEASAERVFEQFMENVQNDGVSAFIVTHNLQLAARMDRVLTLKAGKILPF